MWRINFNFASCSCDTLKIGRQDLLRCISAKPVSIACIHLIKARDFAPSYKRRPKSANNWAATSRSRGNNCLFDPIYNFTTARSAAKTIRICTRPKPSSYSSECLWWERCGKSWDLSEVSGGEVENGGNLPTPPLHLPGWHQSNLSEQVSWVCLL